MPHCPNGHYYEGDTCPYCPKEYASISDVGLLADKDMATKMMSIPVCPKCGKPLRKGIPRPEHGVAVSSLKDIRDHIIPWNYYWNGRCDNCGHDFSFSWNIDMGSTGPDNKIRNTVVRIGVETFLHHITCEFDDWASTVLSGVEIETKCGFGQSEKIFLSVNELKYLMEILKDSPIMQQFDYQTESIRRNMVRT